MGIHHIAFAHQGPRRDHAFYTGAMGFELVKAVGGADRPSGGWAKHLFYDTGGRTG